MTCAEFQELLGAFVLGALDPEERAACEAHLVRPGAHEGCLVDYRRLRESADLLATAVPKVAPPERIWEGIARRLSARGAQPRRRLRQREVVAWALAAAASVAFMLTAAGRRAATLEARRALEVAQRSRADAATTVRSVESERALCLRDLAAARAEADIQRAALRLLEDPKSQVVALAPQGGVPYRGSVVLNAAAKRAVVVASHLEPLPGKDYQLWLIRGEKKVPVSLLGAERSIAEVDAALLAAGAPDAIAITVEPAGGSLQPTGPIVLVAKMPRS